MRGTSTKKEPNDTMQVNLNDDYEVRYWTATLGVPKAKLAEVVAKVGPSVRAVRKELEGDWSARVKTWFRRV